MHNLTKIRIFRILLCLTYPLALLFILPFSLIKKKHTGYLFFFFDRYALGGAQRVHLDILNSVTMESKQLYFTRLSKERTLKKEFYDAPNTQSKDIHFWCDNLLFRLFTVHFYAFYLNRHKQCHVVSSNSTFFYDMLFFLNKHVIKTELLHNFTYGNNGMEFFGLANHKYLDHRLTVDHATRQNIIVQYKEFGVPGSYAERIKVIEPGVPVPPNMQKSYDLPLKVLYAGRGGRQKRVHLLDKIAETCLQEQLPVEFHFAGTMMDELSEYVKSNSVLHGEISRQEDMYALYKQSHVVLMTSAFEGFPMLVKEGMACGCVPVVTALEGNKTHLKNGDNALLMLNAGDEDAVIREGLDHLRALANDMHTTASLCKRAYDYARLHFTKDRFMAEYKAFLSERK